jgi:Acyltransferase C-terminus
LNCLNAAAPSGMVYDMTVAFDSYSGEIPSWEAGYTRTTDTRIPFISKLMAGDSCGTTHVHITAYSMADAAAGGEHWLDIVWQRKDELLEGFIKEGKFPGTRKIVHRRPFRAWGTFLVGGLVLPTGAFCAIVKVCITAAPLIRRAIEHAAAAVAAAAAAKA